MTSIGLLMINYLPKITKNTDVPPSCWENNIGKELYRLMVLFFIVLVFINFVTESLHKLMASYLSFISLPGNLNSI